MQGKRPKFPKDLIAGLIGAVAIIPDGMASAVMAKLNPVNGIYSAVAGLAIGAWSTNSVYMSVATTSALALATGSIIGQFSEEEKIAAVVTLSVMAGVLQIVMGLLKLGVLVRFISNAVMRGFLTGIAFLIVFSQITDITGNSQNYSDHKVLNSIFKIFYLSEWNFITLAVGISTLVLILLIEKTRLEDYAIFISLVIVSVLVFFMDVPEVSIVSDEYQMPDTLPGFQVPDLSLLAKIFPMAVAISLIGFVQSVGVSHLVPNPDGEYPDDSKDLRGQGIANIGCGLFSGFPVGGSLAQTSLIMNAGARSRWTNFISGILAGVLVIFLSNFIEKIPMACFAAILILTGVKTIKGEEIALVWKTGRHSGLVMLFTFCATMVVSLQMAVLISIVITFILHVIRSSNKVELKAVIKEEEHFAEVPLPKVLEPGKVQAIQPYGSLFFAGAIVLQDQLPEPDKANRSVVIINLRGRKEIGSSFIKVIKRYSEELNSKNSKLMLVGVSKTVYHQLKNTRMMDHMGKEDIFKESRILGASMLKAWGCAENWIKLNTD